MSEEEKSIEILKYTRDKCRESGEGRIYFYRVEDLSNAIDTILNLIEKQQKEIEELKDKQDYARLEKEQLLEDMHKDYISKDKIKEEIKELELMTLDDDYIFKNMRDYALLILENLLEEK